MGEIVEISGAAEINEAHRLAITSHVVAKRYEQTRLGF